MYVGLSPASRPLGDGAQGGRVPIVLCLCAVCVSCVRVFSFSDNRQTTPHAYAHSAQRRRAEEEQADFFWSSSSRKSAEIEKVRKTAAMAYFEDTRITNTNTNTKKNH